MNARLRANLLRPAPPREPTRPESTAEALAAALCILAIIGTVGYVVGTLLQAVVR